MATPPASPDKAHKTRLANAVSLFSTESKIEKIELLDSTQKALNGVSTDRSNEVLCFERILHLALCLQVFHETPTAFCSSVSAVRTISVNRV